MTLLLFCGTALAKVEVNAVDSAVTVERKSGDEAVFTVTKNSGVESGQLYLVMIQQGESASEKPKPTKENLYYLNVEAAEGDSISMEAYPKDMGEGSYVVYLSDYANNGAAKGVATLIVSADSGEPVSEYECGDVNHSGGKPDNRDVRDLARYVGEWPDYMEGGSHEIDLSLADVNGSGGKPDNRDVRDLARYVGEWDGYPSLPITK